jgi:chromate transporter
VDSHHVEQDLRQLLKDLFFLFLKLGTIGFGGPAAHVAMMQDEVVKKRNWLTNKEFLDLLSATNFIPGPNSTELAIHIGHRRAGWLGLITAGLAFILPATIIVMGCAWAYVRYGSLPQAEYLLYGIKPVIIAVVLQALWNLAKSTIKNYKAALLCCLAIALYAAGSNEVLVLGLLGLVVVFIERKNRQSSLMEGGSVLAGGALLSSMMSMGSQSVSLGGIFAFFAKVGSVLFGSGYVLLAFLRSDLVERLGWLTEGQLLDAIAIGQFTPGPVFTTATFIGYLLSGTAGAIIATLGIFLPAFIFVALSAPFLPKLRKSMTAGAFLDGLNIASLGLMAVVSYYLLGSAVIDVFTFLIALISAFFLIRFKINSAWLVGGGALLGLAFKLLF